MSGPHAPHLQRRNGIYHLRMRIPDRLRNRVERMEVSRSLKTYSNVIARRLAAIVSARVQETFEVIEKNTEITPAEARNLLQACFQKGKDDIDRNQPLVPMTDYPELEILEQRTMAQDRINALQEQCEKWSFKPDISIMAAEFLQERDINFGALDEKQRLKIQHGLAEALIEQQRYFLHRLNNPFGTYEVANPIFDELGRSHDIHPSRRANILDAVANSFSFIMPWHVWPLFMILTISPLLETYPDLVTPKPTDFLMASFYPIVIWIVMLVAIMTGFGRKFERNDAQD